MFPDYPYTDTHQLNLDWILSTILELKDIIEHGGGGGGGDVQSVNGKTGVVILTYSDVGALSSATVIPTKTSQLLNDSGFLTSAPVVSVNGQTGAVILSIPTKTSDLQNDSGFITSAPVASVNGKTGIVVLIPSDIGAVASNQGSGNAGKFLSIANDGTVTPSDLPVYSGGVG